MKNLLRRWLGLDSLEGLMQELSDEIFKLHEDITLPLSDLAALLRDEHDPLRKKLSDKIGNKVQARLKAEDMARRHTTGEL